MIHLSLALAAVLAAAPAAPAGGGQGVIAFGMGRQTCTQWLASPASTAEGGAWLLGYWSAVNLLNEGNHMVGRQVGSDGVVDGVREVCGATPDDTLMDAAALVYFRFQQDGK